MRKIFIIATILLGVMLFFLGIYNFAFKKSESAPKQEIIDKASAELKTNPIVKAEKITVISDGAVLGPVVDKKTEEIKYYDASTGLVWKMDADGKNKQKITNSNVVGLQSVLWSPGLNKALTVVKKEGRNIFYSYDYQEQKGLLLKSGLDTLAWDNTGTKIFYKYYNDVSKERTLNIANPDGSGWQKIADLKTKKIVIASVPLKSTVSFWNYPNSSEETQLQMVGATGGEVKTILNGKYGADYLWAPSGDMALVSSLSNDKKAITLGTISVAGEYGEIGLPTIASKCVWSQDSNQVYCALPGGIPDGANMPNDYQENKFNTVDTFWKINVLTGEKERVVEVEDIKEKLDATKLFLSATEDALYFVNKIDQKLYRIQL